jgi:hypothetical protein
LLGVGLGLVAVGVAGLIVASSSASCEDLSGAGASSCTTPLLVSGSWIAAAGFAVGAPLLGTGFAQLRSGGDDRAAALDLQTAPFFADRAARRVARGRALVIAGSVLTVVAAGLGATAVALVTSDYHNQQLFQATTALGTIGGVFGMGILASGATLWAMGRTDARLSW